MSDAASPAAPPPRAILVVDDEPNILATLRGTLEDEGYRVVTAGSGEAGLEAIRGEPLDAALFDVRLPDLDGVALLEKSRGLRPDLPVVMMSGHASIDLAVRAVRLGADDFLEKPLQADRLLVVLRNAIERGRLRSENRRLRQGRPESPLIGRSAPIEALRETIRRVAPTRARVLILGESGTGKELVAEAIHAGSQRAEGPFVRLNCAAIPHELIESALFGHEKGAFTGAGAAATGTFEQAHAGTLLLDEVGDLHADTQAKLLRVLESCAFERVGGRRTITVDVRVLAATNKDPAEEIARGRFREDLYFRLAVVPITIPPLRDRGDDILQISEHFLRLFAKEYGRRPPVLSESARRALVASRWPGNIRELRNLMERAVILHGSAELDAGAIAELAGPEARGGGPAPREAEAPLADRLERAERAWIEEALGRHGGRIADAARELAVDRANLHRKMRRLGIEKRSADRDVDDDREGNEAT